MRWLLVEDFYNGKIVDNKIILYSYLFLIFFQPGKDSRRNLGLGLYFITYKMS